jgi:hypothetical protein
MITQKTWPKRYYRIVRRYKATFFKSLLLFVVCIQGCGPTQIALPTNSYMLKGAAQPSNPDTSDLKAIVSNVADPAESFDFRQDNLKSETSRYLKCVADITWEVRKQLRSQTIPIHAHDEVNLVAQLHLTIAKNKRDFDERIAFTCALLCEMTSAVVPACNE